MQYVVCYSGGHSSALAAVETVRRFGNENVILLNHDISSKVESIKIKKFKNQVAEYLQLPITYANCEGFEQKTPLSLCLEHGRVKFRSGHEICTYFLKTQPFYQWLEENYPVYDGQMSEEIVLIYGFDENEIHRVARRRRHLESMGYDTLYPLVEWPRTINNIEEIGISRPRVYFESKHANCIGCLKAGKQHWYKVYCYHRDIFEEAKMVEEQICFSVLKCGYLKDLEAEFEKMRQARVPATENMDSYWFWKYARQ
ncbi:hypothetical protein [Sporofaciens sp. JLR.KK001]|uniref:hypothetical protein n=1 Tax=Sporofaciens sp. JLR.KK001 TaxID=3112621 RepID=UPI002FEFA9DC